MSSRSNSKTNYPICSIELNYNTEHKLAASNDTILTQLPTVVKLNFEFVFIFRPQSITAVLTHCCEEQ